MADLSTTLPLTSKSVEKAYEIIKPYVHQTPLITSRSINQIASIAAAMDPREDPVPQFEIYFKCENMQRIGAFKARGAFHAVKHLIQEMGLDELRKRGVVTHSSGNHAQALALAASTFSIPAHIVMPTISTPSKIAGTQAYTDHVYFSGSTSVEREAVVKEVIAKTGAVLVPPYDHPDIILGQGTAALELDRQISDLLDQSTQANGTGTGSTGQKSDRHFDAVLTPCGGGGLLSGTATYFSDKPTLVFGCEPNYQGANDAERGLNAIPPKRVESVKTLTIADGLRTPLGVHTWAVLTSTSRDKGSGSADDRAGGGGEKLVEGVYSVSEQEIKSALRLAMERLKVFIEPSGVVPLAVLLFNRKFRADIARRQAEEGGAGRERRRPWRVCVLISGGNTTIDALVGMFGKGEEGTAVERAEGQIGLDGKKQAQDVAG